VGFVGGSFHHISKNLVLESGTGNRGFWRGGGGGEEKEEDREGGRRGSERER